MAGTDGGRRLGRIAAWVATVASVLVGLGLLTAVMVASDCGASGGTCPDPDRTPAFDGGPFAVGVLAGVLVAAPPLLLARRRWSTVVGVTLAVALIAGYGSATS